jgi:hypothetical protein
MFTDHGSWTFAVRYEESLDNSEDKFRVPKNITHNIYAANIGSWPCYEKGQSHWIVPGQQLIRLYVLLAVLQYVRSKELLQNV